MANPFISYSYLWRKSHPSFLSFLSLLLTLVYATAPHRIEESPFPPKTTTTNDNQNNQNNDPTGTREHTPRGDNTPSTTESTNNSNNNNDNNNNNNKEEERETNQSHDLDGEDRTAPNEPVYRWWDTSGEYWLNATKYNGLDESIDYIKVTNIPIISILFHICL